MTDKNSVKIVTKDDLKFSFVMAMDGDHGGTMSYYDGIHKSSMNIATPKGGTGKRTFYIDNDKREFDTVDGFLTALNETIAKHPLRFPEVSND